MGSPNKQATVYAQMGLKKIELLGEEPVVGLIDFIYRASVKAGVIFASRT